MKKFLLCALACLGTNVLATRIGHTVTYSPDGRWVAITTTTFGEEFVAPQQTTLHNGQTFGSGHLNAPGGHALFNASGNRLLIEGPADRVTLYDTQQGRLVSEKRGAEAIFDRTGKLLLIRKPYGRVVCYDSEDMHKIGEPLAFPSNTPCEEMPALLDARPLLFRKKTLGEDSIVWWDRENRQPVGHPVMGQEVKYSPNGQWFVILDNDAFGSHFVTLCNAQSMQIIGVATGHDATFGNQFLCVNNSGSQVFYAFETMARIASLPPYVTASPDCQTVWYNDVDGALRHCPLEEFLARGIC